MCQGGTEARASLLSNGRALSVLGVKVPGGNLHLFSGLMQGLTFSAMRLLKILFYYMYYFYGVLFGVLCRKSLGLFSSDCLPLRFCSKPPLFFKNFPFPTFVSLRILDHLTKF